MRKNPTNGEKSLKIALTAVSKEKGWDIQSQVVFKPYIVDFCAVNAGLVFEADGTQHDRTLDYDSRRDWRLAHDYNLRVYRFRNDELNLHLPQVIEKLRAL